ncbi:hypothetical protein [Arthrobacter sp. MA-N2]|uniref:hypothetical protein n=1 Tax=Arthrobacter sp. MA-N2 TaxID=1101188 RepID=UPI0012DD3E38|nr:hypothetical protein [Arthrobacter sp. MA-N2]
MILLDHRRSRVPVPRNDEAATVDVGNDPAESSLLAPDPRFRDDGTRPRIGSATLTFFETGARS